MKLQGAQFFALQTALVQVQRSRVHLQMPAQLLPLTSLAVPCLALPLLPLLRCLQEKLSTCPSIDKGGYYVSSTGKRLVHGDVCNSGLSALIPDTDGKGSLNPGEHADMCFVQDPELQSLSAMLPACALERPCNHCRSCTW